MRIAEQVYERSLKWAVQYKFTVVIAAVGVFAISLLLFGRLGQEFVPTLDEKDILVQPARIPSTSLTQSTKMQFEVEKTIMGFPEVASVYSKTGTAEMANDPMPPNLSDTFVILKPREQWPDPHEPKQS